MIIYFSKNFLLMFAITVFNFRYSLRLLEVHVPQVENRWSKIINNLLVVSIVDDLQTIQRSYTVSY